MGNFFNNIGISGIKNSNLQENLYPEKLSFKSADLYLPKLKNDLYEKTYQRSIHSLPFYQTLNINQYNSKLLLKAFASEAYIIKQINSNPELKAIVDEYGLTEINTKNLLDIVDSHLTTTEAYALLIANKMGLSDDEKKLLQQACIFHDFGKLLIPDKIINKPGPLTKEEKEVMDLHSEVGFQLLKHSGLNDRVLNMVRNHHKPVAENNDLLGQILSVADIYSALREKRAYKEPMSIATAFDILDQKARKGEVSTEVVDSLNDINFFRR